MSDLTPVFWGGRENAPRAGRSAAGDCREGLQVVFRVQAHHVREAAVDVGDLAGDARGQVRPVSYTHLTLPTNREV